MKNAYEAVAMICRFGFAALMLVICFRAWRMTARDRRRAMIMRDRFPQTGTIGELVALKASKPVRRAQSFTLPREGILGSSRSADVRIRGGKIRRRHLVYELRDGGLVIRPLGSAETVLGDGVTGEKLLARDGDILKLGGIPFRVVLYAVPENGVREWPDEPSVPF